MKKHFVIKNDRLEEVRGYNDDDICIERWEIVYNESDQVVGLRPLSPQEVIPQSVLDRMKFWRKPKPLTKILSIDFIGLIQYIGMIYKIKKVVTIEEIEKILEIINIKKVDVIGEITTIRDLSPQRKSLIVNPDFFSAFTGWLHSENVQHLWESDAKTYYMRFPDLEVAYLKQEFSIPFKIDWLSELYTVIRGPNIGDVIRFYYQYTDRTMSSELLTIGVANTWEKKTLSPTAGKSIVGLYIYHANFYPQCDIDDVMTVF